MKIIRTLGEEEKGRKRGGKGYRRYYYYRCKFLDLERKR